MKNKFKTLMSILMLLIGLVAINGVTSCSDIVYVDNVELNTTELDMFVGEEYLLFATVTPLNATNTKVTWESSNPDVAKVENGKVTALNDGTTVVTVTTLSSQKQAICEINVYREYKITFKSRGEVVAEDTFSALDKEIEEPEIPQRKGYESKWDDYSDKLQLCNEDITVNAIYQPIDYVITFVADGQTVDKLNYTVETSKIEEPEVPQKDGYVGEWESYSLSVGGITVNAVYKKIFVVKQGKLVEVNKPTDITELTIPTEVDGAQIKSMAKGVLSKFNKLQTLTIPFVGENLDGTGDTKFDFVYNSGMQSNLNNVIITSATVIGKNAFYDSNINNIVLPDGLETIEAYAFYNCGELTQIDIPSSVTYIGGHAFEYCTNLGDITIPEGLEVVEEYTFRDCIQLTSIVIPKNIKTIGDNAFNRDRDTTKNQNKIENSLQMTA